MAAFRNIFQQIPLLKPKRNIFDLSFDNLVSLNFGNLVPILCKEVLPGDTWQVQSSAFVRFAPMLAPIMHRVNVYVHYFFVPNRIIWKDFEDFITGGRDGQSSPQMPILNLENMVTFQSTYPTLFQELFGQGSLWDYCGLPTREPSDALIQAQEMAALGEVQMLPFAAYRKIYEDYYRDQNLEEDFDVKEAMDATLFEPQDTDFQKIFKLQQRAWEKDYFTSALPWPQRGGDVHLPLSGEAPISGDGNIVLNPIGSGPVAYNPTKWVDSTTGEELLGRSTGDSTLRLQNNGNSTLGFATHTASDTSDASRFATLDPNDALKVDTDTLHADMSEVTSATINELRQSMRLQEWLEKSARSGARYIEQILSHFGVRSSDGRLDRAEYLGGGKAPVSISEVLQTSQTTDTSPLAEFAGHGISVGSSNKFRKFFEEHGWVFGIMSIVPRSSYMNGVPRQFTRLDKFDYAWPEFANLGEQEILNRELALTNSAERNSQVFGYTPRYAEYKFSLNEFHGDFRSSLAFWHLGRMFSDDEFPDLNEDFIKVSGEMDNLNRIFAVEDSTQHHLWCEIYNRITVARTLPKFGVPTL